MTSAPIALPLTPQQRGVYFLHCLAPDSAVYNVPIVLRVRGGLDRERLRAAVDALQSRHQALRLTVEERDGQVLQLIQSAEAAAPVEVSWTRLPGADAETAAGEAVRRAAQPFDVVRGPLMRVDVVELSPDDHALVLCFHHLIIDEVAATALAGELDRLYGDPAALPAAGPEHQYADFCAGLLAEPDPAGLAFWRDRLAGMPVLPLPEEHIPEEHGLFTGDRVGFAVPEKTAARLAEVCRGHRVSEFMVFHAALMVLLHRWTGAADIAVGTPMSGRIDLRFAETVGFFQNTVVLRGAVVPEQGFASLLKTARRTVLESLQRQDTPFEAVVDALRPARESTRNPLFQAALVFNRRKVEQDWTLPGLQVEPLPFVWPASHFDLTLTLLHESGVLKGDFAYSAQRFTKETVERVVAVFLHLLDGLLAAPDAPVGDVELMDADDLEHVLALGARAGRYVLDERLRPLPLGFYGAVHTGDPSAPLTTATGERGRFAPDGRFELWRDPAEAALAAHPAVRAAVIVPYVPSAQGDGHETVGCVVPRPDAELPSARELLTHLQARVPAHLVPQRIVFCAAIPTGADGRPDLDAVAELVAGRPEPDGRTDEPMDEEPRDETERRLAGLFEELLGVPGLGRYDNFFDFGGQSLLAVRLVARVAEEFGRPLGVGVFMNHPTVAALARALADGTPAEAGGLVRLREGDGGSGGQHPLAVALIHPVGGTLMCYGDLVSLLPAGIEVVGLERVAGTHPEDASYQDLVSRYAATLAGALPGRRIALLGWSLGGVLAHSVAAELGALGHDVALVALLDSLAQRTGEDAERMSGTGAELFALAASVRQDGTGVLGATAGQQLLMRRFGVDLAALRETPAEQAARMLEDWGRLLGLVAECAPALPAAPVQLFLCADNPPGYPEALAASWEGLHGELDVRGVPGTHTEVLGSPAVEQVVAAFLERIERS
ncbi:condensation domain-containing protein [Streptomyces sp. NBC_01236]|uniref:condensation domain-containing protein n=1 Tax=Streptomyces sp. NBC_01236 TaxID=2903789 RepID=UPI002E0E7ADE|nr:condensation domain-containing protein [Streptomyces sp. NBC_01236]